MMKIFTKRYDLQGVELSRLVRLVIVSKIVPMGNFHGGPGGRCLAVLILLHYLGYPLYWVHCRYGHRLVHLKKIVAKIRNR